MYRSHPVRRLPRPAPRPRFCCLLPPTDRKRGADVLAVPEQRLGAGPPTGDDFIPVPGKPEPVKSDPAHPYVPNGGGRQPTYRIADLTNPILKPWAIEKMKKANDEVLAGKVPYITRERCWPAGVPGSLVYTRGGQPLFFYQTKDKITIVNELNFETRHIYLNVPHSKNPKPSWYGESVGHFEGDELVIDTMGRTTARPRTITARPTRTRSIRVERYKLIEGGKTCRRRSRWTTRHVQHALVRGAALAQDRPHPGREPLRRRTTKRSWATTWFLSPWRTSRISKAWL
jgi:hypothetical protein